MKHMGSRGRSAELVRASLSRRFAHHRAMHWRHRSLAGDRLQVGVLAKANASGTRAEGPCASP